MDVVNSILKLRSEIHSDPNFWKIFGALSGVFFVVWVIEESIEFVTPIHWGLGAFLTGAAGILLAWFASKIASLREQDTISIVVVLFCLSIFLGAVVCSGLSYVLHVQGWAAYEGAVSDEPMQTFRRFYLWTFMDMVPVINIWKTIPVRSPLLPTDPMAGVPILIFKVFVLAYVFANVARWWKLQDQVR